MKLLILERLFSQKTEGNDGWVTSSELLELTNQKYFDRRTRELRDETGCDLETGRFGGESAYRLNSLNLADVNTRLYLTATQKKALLHESGNKCAVCGTDADGDVSRLQADHKIPLIRRGDHNPLNWQILCLTCNVGKRRACESCALDCQTCPWAFPESVGQRITAVVDPETLGQIESLAREQNLRPDEIASALLRRATE